MAYGYNYGGYPMPGGYYAPPMPDQLAQLRQGYQQPTMQQQAQPQQQPPSNGILWVQGEEGAKAWLVTPGQTVLLMDSDGSSFYLKSADTSGMPLPLRIFDYKERVSAPRTSSDAPTTAGVDYVTRDEWNALAARYDALVDELAALKSTPASKTKKSDKEDSE